MQAGSDATASNPRLVKEMALFFSLASSRQYQAGNKVKNDSYLLTGYIKTSVILKKRELTMFDESFDWVK